MTVTLNGHNVLKQLGIEPTQTCTIDSEASLSRSVRALKVVQTDDKAAGTTVDQTLVERVIRLRASFEDRARGSKR